MRKKEAFFADYSNRQSFPKCEKFTRYLWVPYVAVNKLINGTAVASWLVHYYLRALWTMEFYITGHEYVLDNWPTLGYFSELVAFNKFINESALANWVVHYYLRAIWTMEL